MNAHVIENSPCLLQNSGSRSDLSQPAYVEADASFSLPFPSRPEQENAPSFTFLVPLCT